MDYYVKNEKRYQFLVKEEDKWRIRIIIGQRENELYQLLACGCKEYRSDFQDIQEQYHIILNINKMTQYYYQPHQISQIRMNIIDRLYQYARTGAYPILQDTGDPMLREKYNTIITKFESLKENQYAKAVERMVSYTIWHEDYQPEIKAIFTTKRAQSIIHRLKQNLKNTVAINKIIPIVNAYNQSRKVYRVLSDESIPAEIESIIKRISLLQLALRVAAEYPSVTNSSKIKELIRQRSKQLAPLQISDLDHICLLKDCIRSLEEKLSKFNKNNSRGTLDELLTDRILVPLQKLLGQHQHALQSLDQFKLTPTNSPKVIKEENMEAYMIGQISNLNRKTQQILRRCNVPFQYLEGGDLQRLSAKIESIGQLLQNYNNFADQFQQISLKNSKPYATNANSQQIYPSRQSVSTNRLDNMIEWLKRQSQVKPQYGYKIPTLRFNYGVRNLNNLQQEISSKNKDLQERTVLLNRWQTIWRLMGFQNTSEIFLDRNQYPKKGQKDEPLQAICSQIETLQKCHQEYLDNHKGLRLMTEDEQFLACNPNIKQEFYKDKDTIHRMASDYIQFRNAISNQESQIQALRLSQRQIRLLLDGVQARLNSMIKIERPDIRSTRQGLLTGALDYLERILNYKSQKIVQLSDKNSLIKRQIYELETQIKQITAQKNIAQIQTMKQISQYKRKQQDNAQLAKKTATKLSQFAQSYKIQLAQKESLEKDYTKSISELQKANRQICARDKKIQQLEINNQQLQRDLQQANKRMDFPTTLTFQEQEKTSLQQSKQISQLTLKHYIKWVSKLEETIKQRFNKYEPSLNKLQRKASYVSKIRKDSQKDNKNLQELRQELLETKRNCKQLQKRLKASSKTDQQVKNFKQTISKNQGVIAILKKKVEDLNVEVKRQKSAIADLEISLQGAQSDKKDLQMELQGLKMQLSMAPESSPATYKINHEEMEQKHKRLQAQITNLTEQLKRKTKDLSQMSSRLSQSQIEIMRYEGETETYKSDLKKNNEMIEKFKVTSSANLNHNVRNAPNKKIDQAEIRQTIFKELSIKYQSQFVARKERLTKMYAIKYSNAAQQSNIGELREIYLACIDNFFQGELLNQQIDYKYRLAYHLEAFAGVPILRTKPIYTFDPKNKTNFHLYIDGVTSLLFIVKTVTGLFLAGYYSGKYLQGPMMDPGVLISISKNESFRLNVPDHNSKNSYRCMVYDPYFIIFGNAQIRIKTGQKVLFSNFGIMNSYFNTNNKKLKDFIGFEDKREVEIESYEIYEVLFNHEFYDD